MDFSKTHYCSVSRFLLTLLGQWPYQNSAERMIRTSVVITVIVLGVAPQLVQTVSSFQHLDTFTEQISPLTIAMLACTKFSTLLIRYKKLRYLQEQIDENWRNLKVKEEIEIMEKYVKDGKLYATFYMLYMFGGGTPFFLLVFQPRILDIIAPLNVSRPLKTAYPANYVFIDQEEHFFLITCHMMTCGATVLAIIAASDTFLIICVQYTCGMFAIMGHRMENTLYKQGNTNMTSANNRKIYNRYIVECVHIHRQALKLVQVMESSFSLSYFIQLGLSVLSMSVTLVQIVVLLGALEVVRYILLAIGQLFQIFCPSYQGQRLMDHSTGIAEKIYSGKWYNMPIDTQRILLFMLKKTSIPCYLTAGKFFIFSVESFSMVVQSCVSYFMMLTSFQ